jgi:hypothetical protein
MLIVDLILNVEINKKKTKFMKLIYNSTEQKEHRKNTK